MARSDDIVKGVAIGIGIVVMTPLVLAALAPIARPIARSALKTGVRVYEKGRESLELFNETIDDVIAEVEEEMAEAHESDDNGETEESTG